MGGQVSREKMLLKNGLPGNSSKEWPHNLEIHDNAIITVITSCIPTSIEMIMNLKKLHNIKYIISVTELPLNDKLNWNPMVEEWVIPIDDITKVEGIEYIHLPVVDDNFPSSVIIQKYNAILDKAISEHVGVWVHCWKGQTRCKRVVKNICDDKNATQSFEKLSNKLKDIKYMQKLKDLVVDIEKSTWEEVVSNMLKTILETITKS